MTKKKSPQQVAAPAPSVALEPGDFTVANLRREIEDTTRPLQPSDITVAQFRTPARSPEDTATFSVSGSPEDTGADEVQTESAISPRFKSAFLPSLDGRQLSPDEVPTHFPDDHGPILLVVLADYPDPGSLATDSPFWSGDQASALIHHVLYSKRFCDRSTVNHASKPLATILEQNLRPNYQSLVMTYASNQVRDGRVSLTEDVFSRGNVDRLTNLFEAAAARCPGVLKVVTMGPTAKWVLRALVGSVCKVQIDHTVLKNPYPIVGLHSFDQSTWLTWAEEAFQSSIVRPH